MRFLPRILIWLFSIILSLQARDPALITSDTVSVRTGDSIRVFFLPTARGTTREMYTISGGSFGTPYTLVYGAILIQHGRDAFLFDSGLGSHVDAQFEADMPWWAAPFFKYKTEHPVLEQLSADSTLPRPTRIFLSHAHWDHASGLPDFPRLPVWLPRQEYDYIQAEGPPAVFPSQFIRPDSLWHIYTFEAKPHAGFEQSLDLYGDGSVIMVWLGGHTPGSVGMFVNTSNGRRYFFPGDLVWNYDQIAQLKGKFWLSRLLADYDSDRVLDVIRKLRHIREKQPDIRIIPAHDIRYWPQ